ncbi:MAG: hypothetical protein ACK55I_03620, partial [bacterium]
ADPPGAALSRRDWRLLALATDGHPLALAQGPSGGAGGSGAGAGGVAGGVHPALFTPQRLWPC